MAIARLGHRNLRHPELAKLAEERAASIQNRVADGITGFSGSMWFVYIHVAIFAWWIITDGGPLDDPFPYGLLTMVVSLEAIFLSTFVMISQNRADLRRQVLSEHQWKLVQEEEEQNEELLGLSRQLLELTRQVHSLTTDVHERMGSRPADPE